MPTGQLADSCALWTGFDISIVARSYAQLAGVLAGFAFVVINLVLDRAYRRRGDGKPRATVEVEHETLTGVALMNAFLGLFLSAIQYSLLAGENGCALTGGRAASAELFGGVSFVASVYMLLYAVVQFVSGSAGTLATHCVFIVAVLVPPIAVFFIEATLSDLALALADPKTREPLEPLWDTANNLSIPIALTVVIVCATVWHIGRKRRSATSPTGLRAQRLRTTLPYITVIVVVSVVIRAVSALPVRNPAAHLTPGEAWFWVAVFAVLLVIQSATLSLQEGVETAYADADRPSS
jgi:heme/copper-type cytochrome/quinol oxidase subunit 2